MSKPSLPTTASGYTDLPSGHIAAIATTLEMRVAPRSMPAALLPAGLALRRVERPAVDWYRELFRRIGEPWLWHSRLRLGNEALGLILSDRAVEIWACSAPAEAAGEARTDVGLVELDFREPDACELAFFGLTIPWTGRGVGQPLMAHALSRAWARPIGRLWVHTCTLDHPAALAFYVRSGFVPVKRQLELAPDPRLDGTLAPDAAPGVPVIR